MPYNDILIIHGNSNIGEIPTDDSIPRLEKALEEIKIHQYSMIIVTGGIFDEKQNNIPLSQAMEKYLADKGVVIKIQQEDKSTTTIDNVELTSKLLDRITVLTSDYHTLRTKLIWKLIGHRRVKVIGAKSPKTFKKIATEIVGIGITIAYAIGIKWPELLFRNNFRKIKG